MSPRTAKPEEPQSDSAATTRDEKTEDEVVTTQEAATHQIPMEEPMSDTIAPLVHPALEERHVRVGTVVWGLVLAAVGTGLVAAALGVAFDVELAFIALVAAAGVLLLVGSLASSRRRRS